MNTRFRIQVVLAATVSALVLSSAVSAGPLGDVIREAKGDSDSSAPAPRHSAPPQSAPRESAQRESGPRPSAPPAERGGFRSEPRGDRGPVGNVIERNFERRDDRGNGQGNGQGNGPGRGAGRGSYPGTVVERGGERGPVGSVIERNFERRDGGRSYQPRPPRYVSNLPGGYRQYNWNGRPYYNHGGYWYRPYGNRYVVVGPPYGLFVDYLPGYYSSFWFGSTRYFYADDTYYVYEPARRGYVVTRSPYGDDRNDETSGNQDEDLFVYPSRGQSEQQQADDRYECHRWAADQTHYDPVDSNYNADQRADYLRAMTACLTGRGYSVK